MVTSSSQASKSTIGTGLLILLTLPIDYLIEGGDFYTSESILASKANCYYDHMETGKEPFKKTKHFYIWRVENGGLTPHTKPFPTSRCDDLSSLLGNVSKRGTTSKISEKRKIITDSEWVAMEYISRVLLPSYLNVGCIETTSMEPTNNLK